jgi:deoxyribonuclease V
MELPRPLHTWQVSSQEALNIQKILGGRVQTSSAHHPIRFIAGLAASFSLVENLWIAGVVLWDLQQQKVREEHVATHTEIFTDEDPELLAFREVPALLKALEKLEITPDLLMLDGHGVDHPRRMGEASHLGVFTELPAMGCSENSVFGESDEPASERGAKAKLMYNGHVVGMVLRTKKEEKPLYISIGHQIDLASAEEIVLRCTTNHALPEPIFLAGSLVAKAKQEIFMILKKKK